MVGWFAILSGPLRRVQVLSISRCSTQIDMNDIPSSGIGSSSMSISPSISVSSDSSAKRFLALILALLVRLNPPSTFITTSSPLLFPLDLNRLLGPGENRLSSSSSFSVGSSSASASAALVVDFVRGRRRLTIGVGSISLSESEASSSSGSGIERLLLDADLDIRREALTFE
jgi:hypothetical protein